MKKLDSLQKLIWKCSSQIELPLPPDKEEVWMRLSHYMDVDTKQDQKRFSLLLNGIWSSIKPRLHYVVTLGLILIISLPFAYERISTKSIITKSTDFQTIQLPDGSTITLNAGSQLKYKKGFK